MAEKQTDVSLENVRKTILSWIQSRLGTDSQQWLQKSSKELLNGAEDWQFFTMFSKVPRYTGKDELNLTEEELQQAQKIRAGWRPNSWSIDQLGRSLVLLSVANRRKDEFLELLRKTYESSDMGEAEALYKSIAVLPYPTDLKKWAAEGIRTNMTSVFNAVAHHNPYPAEYLDDDAWNQMVLKALFVESPLYLIQGLDERANKKLADMLVDYAHERWAAGREVSPELWRTVGPYAGGEVLNDLKKVLQHSNDLHRHAAVLALSESSAAEAGDLLEQHRQAEDEVTQNEVTWYSIGQAFNEENN